MKFPRKVGGFSFRLVFGSCCSFGASGFFRLGREEVASLSVRSMTSAADLSVRADDAKQLVSIQRQIEKGRMRLP